MAAPLENRMRLIVEVAHAVRAALPSRMMMGARLSATEWMEGGFSHRRGGDRCARAEGGGRRLYLRFVGRQRREGEGAD